MTELDLSYFKLGSLPAGIFNDLTTLKCLRIIFNQLESLPTEISKLQQLRYIFLTGNNQINLPISILELNLDYYVCRDILKIAIKQAIKNNNSENRKLIRELLDKPSIKVGINEYKKALKFESISKDSRIPQLIEAHVLDSSKKYDSRDTDLYTHCLRQKALRLWKSSATSSHFKLSKTLNGHTWEVTSISFSPDGSKIVSGSGDKTVKIWDAHTGNCLQTLYWDTDWINSVVFSPDGTQIVSGSRDNTIKIWDATTGTCLETLIGHTSDVNSVAVSPDGRKIVSGSGDKIVKIWDAATGKCLQTLKGHTKWINPVAFSPDGKKIVSGSWDKTIKIWDAKSGNCLKTLEGHTFYVKSVAFSPDETKIVSGSWDKTIKIWDAKSGNCLKTLEGHTFFVNSVVFSPYGTKIVSGSSDNTIKIWDAITGNCLQTLEGHTESIISVTFSPDGSTIVSGSGDKTINVWTIDSANTTPLEEKTEGDVSDSSNNQALLSSNVSFPVHNFFTDGKTGS